jgi:hypothetical protein
MSTRPLILLPGENETQALKRRVKVHEFLMGGGVVLGLDEYDRVVYSGPIDTTSHPVCPWHEEDCIAWAEIDAGRGYATTEPNRMSLPERREFTEVPSKPKLSGNPWDKNRQPIPIIEDARDVAENAFAFEAVPDEIVIDGDEEDED